MRRRILVWLSIAVVAWTKCFSPATLAADKTDKEPAKPEPPKILVTLPLAVTAGLTNQVWIRGLHLTNVSELRFTNISPKAQTTFKPATKADVAKDADAKKVGDTQIETALWFPAASLADTNYFILSTPAGLSETHPLVVFPEGALLFEKEPNGGFRRAQAAIMDKTIQGAIQESGDVDVFRFAARQGVWFRAEVYAAAAGSALDAVLTLYDAQAHPLAVNDDVEGKTDPILRVKIPADGTYFLSLIDAHDKGGPTHVYLLSLELAP